MSSETAKRNWAFYLARKVVFAGFLINVAFCVFFSLTGKNEYPYNTFLFRPLDRFQDFYTVLRSTEHLDPYRIREVVNVPGHQGIEVSNYFPLTHILLYPFTSYENEGALAAFLTISVIGFTYALIQVCFFLGIRSPWEILWSWLVFIPMNYAVLMTLDRANIELWVFLIVSFGIYRISLGRHYSGAAAIGVAAAFKAFPLIFLFPLLKERRFGAMATSVGVFVTTSFVSLLVFKGTVASNMLSLREALFNFSEFILAGVNGITHSISLFSFFYTTVITYTQRLMPVEALQYWRQIYTWISAGILLLILAEIWLGKDQRWKQWALLCLAVELLPFPSYDYKLLYNLIPLVFIFASTNVEEGLRKYVWIFSLLIVPKMLVLFADVRISVIFNPLLILFAMILIISERLRPVAFIHEIRRKGK